MDILFKDLQILQTTKQAIESLGFETLTPIQALAIPKAIEGFDIIGQAQTGTGKTFAYGIPMLEKIDTSLKHTQGLIICPTRELATQVYKELLKLVKFNKYFNVALIVGGESYEKQFAALRKNPQIVIATPGRMMDQMDRGTIDLQTVTTLALDEADEMLKMGFQEDIETILSHINETRQILLFSATMPQAIKKIARTYQHDPIILKVENEAMTVDQIKQNYYIVKNEDKLTLLSRILDYTNSKSTIIFSNTKADVDRITENLVSHGYLADALHGDIKQRNRNDVMRRFREHQLEILVGTDVAARGLDIDDVELIINYDLPNELEIYVHRIGRTGRAGKKGLACSFVTPRKQNQLRDIEKFISAKIEFKQIPTAKDVQDVQLLLFKDQLLEKLSGEVDNHLELIKDILEHTTQEQLINVLLDQIIPKSKNYHEIEAVNPKKTRSNERSNERSYDRDGKPSNQRSRSNNQYQDYVINVGRKDKMTPPKFLKFMDDSFGIFQKNIGDIKHENNQTVFGIKRSAVDKLKQNKVVYEGKVVQIKQI
ncbi:MAG: DEAD/DEAH box helicase [Acholeplasmataceae bacterium]